MSQNTAKVEVLSNIPDIDKTKQIRAQVLRARGVYSSDIMNGSRYQSLSKTCRHCNGLCEVHNTYFATAISNQQSNSRNQTPEQGATKDLIENM